MNPLQRRLGILAFASILLKASLPSASWGQIAMFAGLGFAIWQLRSAVFRACMERMLSPLIFYFCDTLCVALFFGSYRVVFYGRPSVSALGFGLVFALFTVYKYRKLMKAIRKALAQPAPESSER